MSQPGKLFRRSRVLPLTTSPGARGLTYPAQIGHCKAEEFVTRRALFILTLLFTGAGFAQAQIIRPQIRSLRPTAWTSLAIGWAQQQGFNDPETGAAWDFGSGPQWRASLEVPMGFGATTVGVVGTIMKMPLIYTDGTCSRCDADATVSQIFGTLRMGGGTGFHQVIDLDAGTTLFSNFRQSNSGTKLGTGKLTQNFTFAIAYGFGYGLSPRTQIFFTQEYALQILKRVPGSANNTARQTTLRFGGRYGLGG